MYSSSDLDQARRRAKRSVMVSVIWMGIAVILLVTALVLRVKALSYLGLILPAMAAYFFYDVYASPKLKYAHFLADLLGGRSHQVQGRVLSVADQARASEEGVPIRDVAVRAQGEDIDTLFYWDDHRPLPAVDPDRLVTITSFGRYIIAID